MSTSLPRHFQIRSIFLSPAGRLLFNMHDGLADPLRQAIEEHARQLGFDIFGVTSPDPPQHINVFIDWLNADKHGEMAYLASENSRIRRSNPRQILPECKSILLLGIRYCAPNAFSVNPAESLSQLKGRIAAYAWGDDYHEVILRRLNTLVNYIEDYVGHTIPHRLYTDTGPILERDLAQRAGLGWIGKNTCLINPKFGSYFLLSEVLLDLNLIPDKPFIFDRCGTCTRCIDACPTKCIQSDRTIDARSCLSYLTIELKSSIPKDLRHQIGEWVFGCDICQQICPWNQRFAEPQGDPSFSLRPGLQDPDLLIDLALTSQSFNLKFQKNPVKRAKRRGYLRNLAVALGNARNPSSVSALAAALIDTEPLVRIHAAWALGQIEDQLANYALTLALETERDPEVLKEIHDSLHDRGLSQA